MGICEDILYIYIYIYIVIYIYSHIYILYIYIYIYVYIYRELGGITLINPLSGDPQLQLLHLRSPPDTALPAPAPAVPARDPSLGNVVFISWIREITYL